jgi:hypothetical protein
MDLNLGRMRQNGSMTTLGPYFRSKSPGHSPAAELPFGSTVLTQRDLSWRCQIRESHNFSRSHFVCSCLTV